MQILHCTVGAFLQKNLAADDDMEQPLRKIHKGRSFKAEIGAYDLFAYVFSTLLSSCAKGCDS